MADNMQDSQETAAGTPHFAFPWTPQQRRIPLDDPFFDEGNIRCNLQWKQISVSDVELEELISP